MFNELKEKDMLLNKYDIISYSIWKNPNYSNLETLEETIKYCFSKFLLYKLIDIAIVKESLRFKEGDVIFTFKDEFENLHKGAFCFDESIGKFVMYLFDEKEYVVVSNCVVPCLNLNLSKDEVFSKMKEAMEILKNSINNDDKSWYSFLDLYTTKIEFYSEENQKALEAMDELNDSLDRATKNVIDFLSKKSTFKMSGFNINLN